MTQAGISGLGLYHDVAPLDSVRDADLRIKPAQGFAYARELKDCVITVDEFAAACHSQPIVFARDTEGKLFAAAVLALPDSNNVFVDPASGAWRTGEYIPAFVRRYPFVPILSPPTLTSFAAPEGGAAALGRPGGGAMQGDRVALGIDRAYAGLSTEEGERLFENGQPTAFTQSVLRFMMEFQAAWDRTLALVKVLEMLKLLEPFQVTARHDNRQQVLDRLLRVSEAKLNKLKDKDSLRLIRNSGLKLAVAHILSLSRFEKLDRYSR